MMPATQPDLDSEWLKGFWWGMVAILLGVILYRKVTKVETYDDTWGDRIEDSVPPKVGWENIYKRVHELEVSRGVFGDSTSIWKQLNHLGERMHRLETADVQAELDKYPGETRVEYFHEARKHIPLSEVVSSDYGPHTSG
jgi:hypothetical protein